MLLAMEHTKTCTFDDIVTKNPLLLAAKRIARGATMHDGGILIMGEPGTEKEMFAAAVHNSSRRAAMPLVELDCVGLPDALMEQAIFGEDVGEDLHPMIEECRGGTLFLQEVGALPLVAQSRIARAMHTGQLPFSSGEAADFDCRVIASTSEDLVPCVEDRVFRGDLHQVLASTVIFIPPLRHRKEDISLLVHKLVREFGEALHKPLSNISDEALQALTHYRWPGNVRELEAVMGRSAALAKGETILLQHLPREIQRSSKYKDYVLGADELLSLATIEKRHIQKVLDHTGWHKVRSAQVLGIDRSTLYDKIRRYHLVNPAERVLEPARI